jgi:outer membrane protein assembly factor BamB
MKKNGILYIYSNGKAAAISKEDGSIVWEVNLRQYAGMNVKAIGQILVEDDKLFIGSGGILLCLAAADGALLWKNELKGWGYNFISMANAENSTAAAAAANAAAAQAAATSAVISATAAG